MNADKKTLIDRMQEARCLPDTGRTVLVRWQNDEYVLGVYDGLGRVLVREYTAQPNKFLGVNMRVIPKDWRTVEWVYINE